MVDRMLKSSNLVTFRATEALSVPGNFSWGNRSTVCAWQHFPGQQKHCAQQQLSRQQKHCLCLAMSLRATKALCAWQLLPWQQKHCLCLATSPMATKALSVPGNFSHGNRSTVPNNFTQGNRSTVCAWQLLPGLQKHCLCPAMSLRATEALSVPSNVSQGNRSTVCAQQHLSGQQKHRWVLSSSLSVSHGTKHLATFLIPFCKVAHA